MSIPNTNMLNESYSYQQKNAVWEKGSLRPKSASGLLFRIDRCGDTMKFSDYGNVDSPYGWEIDHIIPKCLEETEEYKDFDFDNLDNLQPLHWKNNRAKCDTHPWTYTSIAQRGLQGGATEIIK